MECGGGVLGLGLGEIVFMQVRCRYRYICRYVGTDIGDLNHHASCSWERDQVRVGRWGIEGLEARDGRLEKGR